MTVSSLRGSRQAWPKQSGGGVEKVNYVVIPASERESRVSTITLLCRLRSSMQTNLFNGPVMQTLVFTLIPWILDRVEDDKRGDGVIIPLPIVIPASERESRVSTIMLLWRLRFLMRTNLFNGPG